MGAKSSWRSRLCGSLFQWETAEAIHLHRAGIWSRNHRVKSGASNCSRLVVNSLMYLLNNDGCNSNPVSLCAPEKEMFFFYSQFYCTCFCVLRYNKIISFAFFLIPFSRLGSQQERVVHRLQSRKSGWEDIRWPSQVYPAGSVWWQGQACALVSQ